MTITFADVASQQIAFSRHDPAEALVLDLIDTPWMQRLRDISQTANTRLVYMFSEHSRFGHSLGVAHLAKSLLSILAKRYPDAVAPFRAPVLVAALLHDVGHLAPGSHTAFKVWYPEHPDTHEQVSARILREDEALNALLRRFDANLPSQVGMILEGSPHVPPWTVEVLSGGGWNVDRGNWCMVDSVLAGVTYGRYNAEALIDSIVLTHDGHLALKENRLDAMMHFAVSRHAMYRQVYQHRVLLAADMLHRAVVRRARDILAESGEKSLPFADDTMRHTLKSHDIGELALADIFRMREAWWRYHIAAWSEGPDRILADLSSRILNRRLFKTIRLRESDDAHGLWVDADRTVQACGFDPRYYLHKVSPLDVHSGDLQQSMLVLMDDGRVVALAEADPLFRALVREAGASQRTWIVLPAEAKERLGRER